MKSGKKICLRFPVWERLILAAACVFSVLCAERAFCTDAEALTSFLQGREQEKLNKFRKAASSFKDAQLLADDIVLKGNALMAAARNYRKAELYGDEFDCLQKLIKNHLSRIDFSQVVDREYEIADLYFQGHRDIPVEWLPFIRKDDRTIEIYTKALKNAPCSKRSPQASLRLARLYIDEQNVDKALKYLSETSKLYAGTPEAHDATLELASLYYQLAKNGDGDNSYSRKALEILDEFEKKYPDSPEMPWVLKHRQKILNFIAERLHAIGKYYQRIGRKDTAERYYADVVKNYSDTKTAELSEAQMVKMDKGHTPVPIPKYTPYRYPLAKEDLPQEASPILVVPENSNNRWLLPVRDLKKSDYLPADNQTKKAGPDDI